MREEIEKKYLLKEDGSDFATDALQHQYSSIEALENDVLQHGKKIRQGYLPISSGSDLCDKLGLDLTFTPSEARLREKAGTHFFTLKGEGTLKREEVEVKLDKIVFDEYWQKTEGQRVEKCRLEIPYKGHTAEIDVYTDRDLIVAEVEVPSIGQAQSLPALGTDITEDTQYKNKNLAK